MSECIDTVSSLMPSSSGFDGSDVQGILDETIGPYFDEFVERIEELLDAPFLTEASGDYLDLLHGRLYGVERAIDEDDDDYRMLLMKMMMIIGYGYRFRQGIRLDQVI